MALEWKEFRESLNLTPEEEDMIKLEKSLIEAADPNTKWLSHDEVVANLKKQREARSHV